MSNEPYLDLAYETIHADVADFVRDKYRSMEKFYLEKGYTPLFEEEERIAANGKTYYTLTLRVYGFDHHTYDRPYES